MNEMDVPTHHNQATVVSAVLILVVALTYILFRNSPSYVALWAARGVSSSSHHAMYFIAHWVQLSPRSSPTFIGFRIDRDHSGVLGEHILYIRGKKLLLLYYCTEIALL